MRWAVKGCFLWFLLWSSSMAISNCPSHVLPRICLDKNNSNCTLVLDSSHSGDIPRDVKFLEKHYGTKTLRNLTWKAPLGGNATGFSVIIANTTWTNHFWYELSREYLQENPETIFSFTCETEMAVKYIVCVSRRCFKGTPHNKPNKTSHTSVKIINTTETKSVTTNTNIVSTLNTWLIVLGAVLLTVLIFVGLIIRRRYVCMKIQTSSQEIDYFSINMGKINQKNDDGMVIPSKCGSELSDGGVWDGGVGGSMAEEESIGTFMAHINNNKY